MPSSSSGRTRGRPPRRAIGWRLSRLVIALMPDLAVLDLSMPSWVAWLRETSSAN